MNGHLNDEQWAAAALQEIDEPVARHLADCPACRGELASFARAAETARAWTRSAAEQPEAFWTRQRTGIRARFEAREQLRPWKRWVWVTATVTLILVAATLLSRKPPQPVRTIAQPDPDDALLLSVQQSIRSDLPAALRPAALLTREIDRNEARQHNP